jgi:hypothetical protein
MADKPSPDARRLDALPQRVSRIDHNVHMDIVPANIRQRLNRMNCNILCIRPPEANKDAMH